MELSGDKYIYQTSSISWRKLVEAITTSNHDDIVQQIIDLSGKLCDPSSSDRYVMDVTSEGVPVTSGKQLCDFSMTLRNASLIQVQMSADMFKGLPSPRLQLFNLTPTLDICIEHRMNPVQCFANVMTRSAAKQSYPDVAAYQSNWLPVIAMEAAKDAVHSNSRDQILVHHVPIVWTEQTVDDISVYKGVFQMPQQFCLNRAIFFGPPDVEQADETDVLSYEDDCDEGSSGYVCVRYGGNGSVLESPNVAQHPLVPALEKLSAASVWVAHCVVNKVVWLSKACAYAIHIRLHHTSTTIPHQFLTAASGLATATIEWIPKGLPNRRAEIAVLRLEHSSPLAKAIALHRQPQSSFDDEYLEVIETLRTKSIAGLSELNAEQREAVEKALQQPFTLIQGPPGTGKSVCCVWLACLFVDANRAIAAQDDENGDQKQVMICGPSNKSVDVLAHYLRKLPDRRRIVRLYSASIERASYPLPSHFLQLVSPELLTPSDEQLRDISLHHMVHGSNGMSADEQLIRDVDERIRAGDGTIDVESMRQYKEAIRRVEIQKLREAEIILCTCSTSCLSKISQATNIQQLLIDESGMCTEPETLIPVVYSRATQVVLLGDHPQLEPIVMDNTARKCGLARSLFESYASKAIMLTRQYRMHEAIAAFPSTNFYDRRLTIGKDEQSKSSALKFWPNGRSKPMAFVHVIGCEQALPVSSADGCEQSKFNLNEVEAVVKTVTKLIHRFHVLPTDVAVLTQYRAQLSYIERELQKRGENGVTVSTVIAAQGSEWEYVVMSTVRSMPKCSVEKRPTRGWIYRHLGFIADSHQINVALTRAKKGLIIIGNKYLLQCDENWKKLIMHYNEHKKIVNMADFMP